MRMMSKLLRLKFLCNKGLSFPKKTVFLIPGIFLLLIFSVTVHAQVEIPFSDPGWSFDGDAPYSINPGNGHLTITASPDQHLEANYVLDSIPWHNYYVVVPFYNYWHDDEDSLCNWADFEFELFNASEMHEFGAGRHSDTEDAPDIETIGFWYNFNDVDQGGGNTEPYSLPAGALGISVIDNNIYAWFSTQPGSFSILSTWEYPTIDEPYQINFDIEYGIDEKSSAGGGVTFGNLQYVEISAVPVPSAIWLLGSGLIGLVGFRKKFKKV